MFYLMSQQTTSKSQDRTNHGLPKHFVALIINITVTREQYILGAFFLVLEYGFFFTSINKNRKSEISMLSLSTCQH